MHAKMTRDRKKSFIANIEKTIEELQSKNQHMKDVLSTVTQTHFKSLTPLAGVTPISSPETCSVVSHLEVPPLPLQEKEQLPPVKKVCHGLMLDP